MFRHYANTIITPITTINIYTTKEKKCWGEYLASNSPRTANLNQSHRQYKESMYDIKRTFEGITEEFNLNAHYLKEIGFLMEEWRLLHLYGIEGQVLTQDFFDRAIRILDATLDLLSPKLTDLEIKKYNMWIRVCERDSQDLFEKRETGIWLNKEKYPKTKYKIRYVYRYFVRLMEIKGMLTKVKENPYDAIEEME